MPLKTPLTVFFNPNNFNDYNYGANGYEMGLVFHEGLHGFIGISDRDLKTALGCNPDPLSSSMITDYIGQFLTVPPPVPGNQRDCTHFQ